MSAGYRKPLTAEEQQRLWDKGEAREVMGGCVISAGGVPLSVVPYPDDYGLDVEEGWLDGGEEVVGIATGELWDGDPLPVRVGNAAFDASEHPHGEHGHWAKKGEGRKMPDLPWFYGEGQQKEDNVKAAKEMKALAEAGDAAGVKAHKGTPSPKLEGYRQQLLAELAKPAGKSSKPTAKAPAPKAAAASPSSAFDMSGVYKPIADHQLAEQVAAMRDHVAAKLGMTQEQVKDAVTGDCDPTKPEGKQRAAARAKVADAVLLSGQPIENAALHVLSSQETGVAGAKAASLTKGDKLRSSKEYASTPVYDLNVLSSVEVADYPVKGQAVCQMADRWLKMGTTSVTGDYRHELGHAIRSAMGGSSSGNTTEMTKAVAAEFDQLKKRMAADPPTAGLKLAEAEMEAKWGAISFRSKDTWEEHAAEHYRGYHRALYRDREEGGNGKHLAQYRAWHPGWAKIWDSWYTAALLGAI